MSSSTVTTTVDRTPPPFLRRLVRWSLRILIGLSGLFVVALAWMLIVYPVEYVQRILIWMEADVDDHLRFPERRMGPSSSPLIIPVEWDPNVLPALAAILEVEDAEVALNAMETQALIVIQDGRVLYEGYFNGSARDSVVTSFSVAKSFNSAMFGVALSEGLIDSIDQPITDYLPELLERDPRFADITIRHLLAMSSGIHYVENSLPAGDDTKTYYWPDLRDLALRLTAIDEPPGQRWHYVNYNPLLEGLILERATAMAVTDYLASRIWEPLGAEYGGSWSLDSPDGFEKMESGINGRSVDFAKLGLLLLGGGRIGDNQIVSASWVSETTTPIYPPGSSWYEEEMVATGRIGYGLHWWTIDGGHGTDFAALGNHGQVVYISPAMKTVMVRHGRDAGIGGWGWMETFYELSEQISS